jgi:hypothetical protein
VRTLLVYGHGASTLSEVREADSDLSLLKTASPGFRRQVERLKTEDEWLVLVQIEQGRLDADAAVKCYEEW